MQIPVDASSGKPMEGERVLFIDPARVTSFTNVRPLDAAVVSKILSGLTCSGKFHVQHAVTGRVDPVTQDVYLIDGAHRCMAVLIGRNRNLPGFAEMLVPLVEKVGMESAICDAVLALDANAKTALHKKMSFADQLLFVARLRDTMHDASFPSDSTPLSERTWKDVNLWTIRQSSASAQREVEAALVSNMLGAIFHVVQALKPATSLEIATQHPSDCRPWEMFLVCTGYVNCSAQKSIAFPSPLQLSAEMKALNSTETGARAGEDVEYGLEQSISVHSRADLFSRTILDCEFIAKGKRTRNNEAIEGFFSTAHVTEFEKVLFLSVISTLRQATETEVGNRKKRRKTVTYRFGASSKHSQRVGYAVHHVVCGWNSVAIAIGYPSAENMFAPYILFQPSCSGYVPISREEGWAPNSQKKTLLHGCKASKDANRICGKARNRGEVVDQQLRMASARFLQDVLRCSSDSALFAEKPDAKHLLVQVFVDKSGPFGIPPALDAFIQTLPALYALRASTPDACQTADTLPKSVTENAVQGLGPEHVDNLGRAPRKKQNETGFIETKGGGHLKNTLSTSEHIPDVTLPSASSCIGVSIGGESEEGTARKSLDMMKEAMRPYIATYPCCFRDLVVSHAKEAGENSLVGKVQLILTDPPYTTRNLQGLPNSDHDVLTPMDIRDAGELISNLLRPGGHALVFCGIEQLNDWKAALGASFDMAVDKLPLFAVRAPGAYSQQPFRLTTTLHNMVEVAVHATKLGAGKRGYEMVSYSTFDCVPSRFPGWCNVIDNVPKLSPAEQITYMEDDKKMVLRPEQKALSLMKELISRFSVVGDIVVDLFAGTYASAEACISMPKGQYRTFVGCEVDNVCHEIAQERLLRAFCMEYMRGTFGLVHAGVRDAAKAVQIDRGGSSKTTLEWVQPEGLPAFSCLPRHLVNYLQTFCVDLVFEKDWAAVPLEHWPEDVLRTLEALDCVVLRNIDCLHYGTCVRKSSIPQAGEGLFTSKAMKKGDVLGWYHGTIVYRSLQDRNTNPGRLYGKGCLSCSVNRFKRYAMGVTAADAQFGNFTGRKLFVVPPIYCSASMINDPRRTRNEASDTRRSANVEFREEPFTTLESLTDPFLCQLVALRDIDAGEEIFGDYGAGYDGF
jgi:DNA methylase